MADRSLAVQDSIDAQRELFRLARHDCGLTLNMLADRHPDLKLSTISTWAKDTVMPAWAIGALSVAGVPDHILSLIYQPFHGHYGTDQTGDGCIDDAAGHAAEFARIVSAARHPNGPGGTEIVPQERGPIADAARRLCGSLRRAVRL